MRFTFVANIGNYYQWYPDNCFSRTALVPEFPLMNAPISVEY